jgi:hypothetical protein
MPWKRMLAYITGSVNESLLRRIEYLLEENRILRNQIQRRITLPAEHVLGSLRLEPLLDRGKRLAFAFRP